ncbi:GNAT family N-acetyltransferase [Allomuricauda sp. F6463D]|uniref:GNAT family N-acetyltransferase n=1 Tax=Allomuricauda sp. F6463D TaxID=2926409 RepID=UPI001FF3AD70|nr:GNAT family N-acetyltransferase [Muricauda sp. F6463D]MCK0161097.1 GNAT family N-acetyltransferase [Muricauda sp. F6463D]
MSEAIKINYLNKTDAESLFLMMNSNTDIFKRFFPKTLEQNHSIEASHIYISKKSEEIKSQSEFTFAIRNNLNIVIGLVILKDIKKDIGEGELAYCLDKNVHGKGIATKCVKHIATLAFKELNLKKLKIHVHKSNLASIKVAEKIGFRWAQTLLKSYQPPGEPYLDMELYELDYEK